MGRIGGGTRLLSFFLAVSVVVDCVEWKSFTREREINQKPELPPTTPRNPTEVTTVSGSCCRAFASLPRVLLMPAIIVLV